MVIVRINGVAERKNSSQYYVYVLFIAHGQQTHANVHVHVLNYMYAHAHACIVINGQEQIC